MAEQEREDRTKVFDKLSGTQKSAILMMLLGEDEASEILKNLTPKEVQHLGSARYSVEGLDQDTVNKVLDEYKIKLVTPDIPVFAWKPMLFMIGTVGAMYLWKYLHTL